MESASIRTPACCARRAQVEANAELDVRRCIRVAVGEWLGVLAAGRSAFVEENDGGARLGRGDGGGQAGGAATYHQHVGCLVFGRFPGRRRFEGRRRSGQGAGDPHAAGDLGQARALADAAVHA